MKPSVLLVAVLLAAAPAGAGQVHEVPGDFATIAAALGAAAPDDTVRVASGTYAPSTNGEVYPLSVPDGVVLAGAGMFDSILDAEQSARVILLSGAGSARVTGFTLRGGVADRGGGIQVEDGTHEIDANLIIDCGALLRGSAINAQGTAAPNVHHNVLWDCYDTDLEHGGDPHVAHWGESAAGRFEHNLVGRGDSNGLFILESASPQARHNIFLDNGIEGVRGRGICFAGDPSTVISHNLFWGNKVAALIMRNEQGNFANMDAATANAVSMDDNVYGNIDGDPMLEDPDAFDFTLMAASPAIDAGEPGSGTDPDGTPLDLGPFHHPATVVAAPTPARRSALGPARPNPFNPRTTLELRLERAGPATLTIHDARGRHLRTLFTGVADAGAVPIEFDGLDDAGRPLASGVYFARLSALGEVHTTGMVLVR